MMAAPQAFHQYQQNKGPLVPGQSISVNKYTVQVERYLSQGGFAHVYLVRTATPVYNTTHHVLKRIAVANEAMLTAVKKEVDIMRLLKGHPNIVHLIDAAWHRMSNGLYEVFILMEFCQGGGIIDMMNRRLRERLTEAEILQIFVDVCEGVAHMHNSRPPLLHRDLKVENILQSSTTSYKLCDFGSATTVTPRPPSNMQEIRLLEDDLNRHTTLQYRAPEMVDVHLRRPIDEKSDVWALGVLLYKLCYYTTPFEEHGPLAILNVQYRTPPYPVYSPQMNGLIAMMLREYGTQRPTVFELLTHVHTLRGTKSRFQYTIPPPQPLSPRQSSFKPVPSPNHLENTISYRQAPSMASSITSNAKPPINAGIQARDKVLEAIAPMRRGRPTPSKESSLSRPASPDKNTSDSRAKEKNWLDDEEQAWETIASKSTGKGKQFDDAWAMPPDNKAGKKAGSQGFGDDFGEQLWKASNPNAEPRGVVPSAASETALKSQPVRPPFATRISDQPLARPNSATRLKEKDAFDGLGLSSNEKPAPTLAEARKLRTGLALMSPSTPSSNSSWNESGRLGASSSQSSSPRPPYSSQNQSLALPPTAPLQPSSSGSSWSSQPPASRPSSSQQTLSGSAETRFPSLEELDATFSSGPSRSHLHVSTKAGPHAASQPSLSKTSEVQSHQKHGSLVAGRSSRLGLPSSSSGTDGTRSEQITGIAMRGGVSTPGHVSTSSNERPDSLPFTRGSSIRRHRSSLTMKQTSPQTETPPIPAASRAHNQEPSFTSTQRDWLTGDDSISDVPPPSPRTANGPVLRDSPSKRASFIQKSTIQHQKAIPITHDRAPSPSRVNNILPKSTEPDSPSTRFHRVFPELDTTLEPTKALTDNWSPVDTKPVSESKRHQEPVSSGDEEGPEEASGRYGQSTSSQDPRKSRPKGHKGRQSSVHDLVDLWGGSVAKEKEKEKEIVKSTVTPAPKPTGLDKRRSLAAPPSPRKQTISPLSSTYSESASMISSPPLASPSSSTSSRSRPQSMFLFPSKAADHSADSSAAELRSPVSSSLLPPADPQPRRTTRRTSISDMVQRYEAIDATARNPTPKPAPLRVNNLPTPESMPPRSPAIRRGYSNGKSPSLLDDSGSVEEKKPRSQFRSVSSSIPKPSASGLPRKTSPAPSESDKVQEAEPPTRMRQPSTKFESATPFPAQKPTTEDIRNSQDTRSPSPERPYQGVGRLIDQWQRKTAESESTRTPTPSKRGGGFVTKRAGIVSSDK